MNNIFLYCSSLTSLPNISNWNVSNIQFIEEMLRDCLSLSYLCNICKWEFLNLSDKRYMFENCLSLLNLPDTSKWTIIEIEDYDDQIKSLEIPIYDSYDFDMDRKMRATKTISNKDEKN